METIEKYDIIKMKANIKNKVNEQKFYKNQRKTVNLIGERKMLASDAVWRHITKKEDLRIIYAAYGLARGKSFSCTENHYPEENHPLHDLQDEIDVILERYKVLEEVEN